MPLVVIIIMVLAIGWLPLVRIYSARKWKEWIPLCEVIVTMRLPSSTTSKRTLPFLVSSLPPLPLPLPSSLSTYIASRLSSRRNNALTTMATTIEVLKHQQ